MPELPHADRVLLAEDNPVSERVTAAMLAHLGLDAEFVSDGAQAVASAMRQPPRVILMDCQLPILDGYDATREIRRREDADGHIPIIAVTVSTTAADRQRCLSAGMDDVLSKPFGVKALAAALARWAPVQAVTEAPFEPAPEHVRAVLDPEIVGRLQRLGSAAGEDLVGQLADLFLVSADDRIRALRHALAGDDAAAVDRAAHGLRGAAANLGATDLVALCADLSADAAGGTLAHGPASLEAIEVELIRVRSALDSLAAAR